MSEFNYKPTKNKIAIKVSELPEQIGMLYTPQIAKDKHRAKDGVCVALGSECKLGINIGDTVFFEDFAGSRLYIDGVDYLFVTEDAILGVIPVDGD